MRRRVKGCLTVNAIQVEQVAMLAKHVDRFNYKLDNKYNNVKDLQVLTKEGDT